MHFVVGLQVVAEACRPRIGTLQVRCHSEGSVVAPVGWESLLWTMQVERERKTDRRRERERETVSKEYLETKQTMNIDVVHQIFPQISN